MPASEAAASSTEARKNVRFTEPAKFLPVVFVSSNIVGLYVIYVAFHLIPMMQFDVDRELQNKGMQQRAITEFVIFQYITLMLVICYLKSILTHPGDIPDKDQDATWEYVPTDTHKSASGDGVPKLQEQKRSGERRYCKWCAKYKPDRCHHCRVCRTCVLKMDHHCPWIYNCVGFRNHKFFFLLLFYSVIDLQIIMWTMTESVKESVDTETPFITMFLLLFGETLASFLGILVTAFFGFHIWLMMKGMTTIEFCEKSMKKAGYNTSAYDLGPIGNIQAVLGPNPLLWFFPCSPPSGDGLRFGNGEKTPLLSQKLETGRGSLRRSGNRKIGQNKASQSEEGGSGSEHAEIMEQRTLGQV